MEQSTDRIREDLAGQFDQFEKLGQGAMGVVYKARQVSLERPVAIKTLLGQMAGNEEAVRRFIQEGRTIARIPHPNIVGVIDYLERGDNLYIVMEFVEGDTLDHRIERTRKAGETFDLACALHVVVSVARALQHAHDNGIVHRDIKPANIMMGAHDLVKVMDFGIARLADSTQATMTGMKLGTPVFMAPEQARGTAVDGRTDIYALGVLLFYLLTGRYPFEADDVNGLIYQHIHEPPPHPREIDESIPVEVEAAILKCMAKNPDDRFQTAGELAEYLDSVAQGQCVSPVSAPATVLTASGPRLKGFDYLVAGLLFLVGAAAGVWVAFL